MFPINSTLEIHMFLKLAFFLQLIKNLEEQGSIRLSVVRRVWYYAAVYEERGSIH